MTKKNNFGTIFNVKYETLGDYLKHTRTSQNLTIDSVAEKTKIRKYFIEALENNDYKKLPERTYALGYLRSYAKFLELDNAEELVKYLDNNYTFIDPSYSEQDKEFNQSRQFVQSYKEDMNNHEVVTLTNNAETKHNKKIKLSQKNKIKSLGLLLSFAIIILLSYVYLTYDVNTQEVFDEVEDNSIVIGSQEFSKVDKKNIETENKPATIKEPNQDINKLAEKQANLFALEKNDSIKINPNKPINVFEDKPNEDVLIIKKFPADTMPRSITLNFNQEVWVQIYQADSPNIIYLDKIFKANDTYKVPGIDNIAMKVGNFTAITFSIANKTYTFSSNKKNNVVINNIKLNKDYLLQTYGNNVIAE